MCQMIHLNMSFETILSFFKRMQEYSCIIN